MFESFNIEITYDKEKDDIFNCNRCLLFIMVILLPILLAISFLISIFSSYKPMLEVKESTPTEIKLEKLCLCEKYLFVCRLAN